MYCSKMVAISRLVWVIMFSISAECQLFTFSIFEENTVFNNVSIVTENMLNLSNYSVVRCGSQCLQSVHCSSISYLESSHGCTLHFSRDIITMKAVPGMTHMTVRDVGDTRDRNLRLYAYNGTMFAGDVINSGGMDADDWLRTSAVQVTNTKWNLKNYNQMFFLDHEYLMTIFDDKPWKGKLDHNTDDWISEATALGNGGWTPFTLPFVDKTRTTLYMVRPDGKLCSAYFPGKSDLIIKEHCQANGINWKTEFIRLFSDSNNQLFAVTPAGDMYRGVIPETSPVNTWLNDATRVGGSEWLGYKFLSCLPSGVFLAVRTSGEMYIGNPPQPGRAWLPEAVFLGRGWDQFQSLLVRPNKYVI